MHTLTPLCPSPLNYLTRARHSVKTRFTVKCGYGFESSSFSQGLDASRADWQSSCAILASKVASQREDSPTDGDDNNNNVGAVNGHNAAVNGHRASVTNLNIVPIKADGENIKPIPPKPLTISDPHQCYVVCRMTNCNYNFCV